MKKKFIYIYNLLKPHLVKEVIGILTILISTFLSLLQPYIMKRIIDSSIVNKNLSSLYINLIIYVLIFLFLQIFSIIKDYIFKYIKERLLYDLRLKLYRNILTKKITFFNKRMTGELISRIINELPSVIKFFTETVVSIFTQVITLIIAIIMMLNLNKQITFISLAVTPFIFLVLKYYNPKFREINNTLMNDKAQINDRLEENLNNIDTIKYTKSHKYSIKRLAKTLHKTINDNFNYLWLNKRSNIIISILNFSPSVFLLGYGGYLAINGQLTIGSIVALNSYLNKLFSPIKTLSQVDINFQKYITAFDRYYDIIKDNQENTEDKQEVYIDNLNEGIKIEDLTFSYNHEQFIFNDFNLKISHGEKVLVTGNNGTGKTTFIYLLCRMLKPDRGVIKYNNIPLQEISKFSLRELIGVVPQEIKLFNDSIHNNIVLGKKVPQEQIINLSKKLGFTEITQGEEINLNYEVRNEGNNLSGGQRKKIGILRALIRNPEIIIFDEVFNSLDQTSIKNLQQYLDEHIKDKILIIVSHREIETINPDKHLDFNQIRQLRLEKATAQY